MQVMIGNPSEIDRWSGAPRHLAWNQYGESYVVLQLVGTMDPAKTITTGQLVLHVRQQGYHDNNVHVGVNHV